ncbi:MAG: hypothetical protein ACRENE_29180 [Polyangiaceae bacterium]
MTFKLAAPPTNGIDLVQRGIRSLTAGKAAAPAAGTPGARRVAMALGGGAGELAAAAPHPVYDVPSESILSGNGFDEARIVAWRYLLTRGPKVVGAAEVSGGTKRMAKAFAGVHRGPFAEATASILEEIESSPEFSAGEHELRMVRIPAFYVMALWLHAHGADDLVVPLPPAPAYLHAGERYEVSKFCSLLSANAPDLAGQAPVENNPKRAALGGRASSKKTGRKRRS